MENVEKMKEVSGGKEVDWEIISAVNKIFADDENYWGGLVRLIKHRKIEIEKGLFESDKVEKEILEDIYTRAKNTIAETYGGLRSENYKNLVAKFPEEAIISAIKDNEYYKDLVLKLHFQ